MQPEGNSYEAIVEYPNGRRQQMHFKTPVAIGDRVRHAGSPAYGTVAELVCEGCWKHPCECLPDDICCDPE